MKKLFALLLLVCLVLPILAGCSGTQIVTSLPEWMNGKDALRLMLANERLDVDSLKNAENIFANGVEVLQNLATMSVESLAQYDYAAPLAVTPIASKKETSRDGSVVEIDGQIYKFKSFAEYSNSYDYFMNLTTGVSSTAEQGAELIDNVKKYVRAVDVWVEQGWTQYYLHVEENSETLISRDTNSEAQQFEICRRTKGADGLNIYEIYIGSDTSETIMTYIPGKKCEYSHRSKVTDFDHNFLAENTKGYWEVVDVNKASMHYNVSCMVIKDDICYDAIYSPSAVRDYGRREETVDGHVALLKVISSDRKTDIINMVQNAGSVSAGIALQAFTGYSHVEYTADVVERIDSEYYMHGYGTLVLKNGMRLTEGMTLLDGQVTVHGTNVHFQNKEGKLSGYVPALELEFTPADGATWQSLFREFLTLTGLSCTRDMRQVEAGITQAYRELDSFTKYHKWNDSLIISEDTIAAGYQNLDARFKASAAIYTAVKDTEVIDYSDRDKIELRIPFAPITVMNVASVTADGLFVTVNEISLTVEDTMLFVEGEPYAVHFAMVGVEKNDQGLVHIAYENAREFVYNGESTFTVSTSAEFDIPFLNVGEYALVAYISTADGIRTSGYRPLPVVAISDDTWDQNGVVGSLYRTGDGELRATFTEHPVIRISLGQDSFASYSTLRDALSEAAYGYGFVEEDATLEFENADGDWVAVTDTEAPLAYGIFRLRYTVHNGNAVKEGYVTAQHLQPGGE